MSTGGLLNYKAFGTTSDEFMFGIAVDKYGHVVMAGRSVSLSPRMTLYSSYYSMFFMKGDISLEDTDCW